MENAELDKISEAEMIVEDMERFQFKLEPWAEEFEVQDVLREKENELIIATAALDLKEKRNKELEMELEKTKLKLRESEMKIYGENQNLKKKIAEQEVRSKKDWEEITKLRFDNIHLSARLKKQEGAGEDAYEKLKWRVIQLENSAEEKRAQLEKTEGQMNDLQDLLKLSEKKATDPEDKVNQLKEMQNLMRERESSIIHEKQRLEKQVQRISQTMEMVKLKQKIRIQNLKVQIFDFFNETLDDYKPQQEETETDDERMNEAPTTRKRVKKAASMNANGDKDEENNLNYDSVSSDSDSSGEEYQAKRNRYVEIGIEPWIVSGRKSRRGRARPRARTSRREHRI